jgi:hypothetical protein
MRWNLPVATLLLTSLVGSFAAYAQIASPPEIIGALAGPGSDPVQPDLWFYGTDLGWTVQHKGNRDGRRLHSHARRSVYADARGTLHRSDQFAEHRS